MLLLHSAQSLVKDHSNHLLTAAAKTLFLAAQAAGRETALSRDAEAASRAAAEVLVANLKAQVAQLQACSPTLVSVI